MNLKTVQDIATLSQTCIDLIKYRWEDLDKDTRMDIYHIGEIVGDMTERVNKTLKQEDVETTVNISSDLGKVTSCGELNVIIREYLERILHTTPIYYNTPIQTNQIRKLIDMLEHEWGKRFTVK